MHRHRPVSLCFSIPSPVRYSICLGVREDLFLGLCTRALASLPRHAVRDSLWSMVDHGHVFLLDCDLIVTHVTLSDSTSALCLNGTAAVGPAQTHAISRESDHGLCGSERSGSSASHIRDVKGRT